MPADSALRLVAGLGNPGPEYEGTRHNAGCWFVERLAERHGGTWRHEARFQGDVARVNVSGEGVWLLRPGTFMNHSGQCVGAMVRYYRLDPRALLVAHDDLDLSPGTVRLKRGGGHGGHNGLRSIDQHLGSRDYLRLRIGIGHPGHRDRVVPWVLGRPAAAEREAIEAAIDRAVAVFPLLVEGELERAMHSLHTD